MIKVFENRDFCFSSDKYGRFHHIFTICPRELRPFATWKGEELWTVDVSCCHPALASLLYQEDCEEKRRYIDLVKNNKIYEFIKEKAGIDVDFNDPIAKSEFKKNTFNKVYYGSNYASPCPRELIVMKEHFPIFVKQLQWAKRKHQKYFAQDMQRWESEVILKCVAQQFAERRKGKEVCLISIHDALVTTPDSLLEIAPQMKSEFTKLLGFPVKLKSVRLSGNWDGVQLNDAAKQFILTLGTRMPYSLNDLMPVTPGQMGISSFSLMHEGIHSAEEKARCDHLEIAELEEGEDPF